MRNAIVGLLAVALMSCPGASPADSLRKPSIAIFDRLASGLDPSFPGRGFETYTKEIADEPMAYGSIAYAAAEAGRWRRL